MKTMNNIIYGKPPLIDAYPAFALAVAWEHAFSAISMLCKAGLPVTKDKMFWINLYYDKWDWI